MEATHYECSTGRLDIALPRITYPLASFLGLPGEVRNEIWRLATTRHHEVHGDLAMLKICRQIYHEMCLTLFENAIFDFTTSNGYSQADENPAFRTRRDSALAMMPPILKRRINHIRTYASFLWIIPLLAKHGINLERLEIACEKDWTGNIWADLTSLDLMLRLVLKGDIQIKSIYLPSHSPFILKTVHNGFVRGKPQFAAISDFYADQEISERLLDRRLERYFIVRLSSHGREERELTIVRRT